MEKTAKNNKRRFTGIVASIAMQNTVSVRVDRVKIHPRYRKRYRVSKKYACDYRKNDVALGDKVVIEETRPISRTKKWKIVEKI
ncbi:MAG: 30S ribosomal protein S17 [Parcubacteria group bacterium CG_4_9_14_0_2_um_filter_41_8]|nr:MAG: 30S ribosomal protein S17 [Parcubacteria group bacterium CG1_02_41_12]PIP67435.1 MAG: 30S ribosomal protein S17 [Parcubacteria group bacterium CG22_combo_CG10-13_8_21_14_all_41_9]PIQ79378.1 MAG: 30S ribosomal protein S17 [Parcubacteria group bacterium CG11_big_fil_rev_8_21_14_0_20_41_14]PIR57518.1 MAG: 30S ribosomal protein S17 [Parcubacteria group bacterium CG10_big_fil_rev_8_21_14_0_10_41_35]PJC40889.1 MAG: 30S ribosomal protein S17 [Parcubacteria group bacterium CG_4_9_14_0_2_um_filt